jgi:hypothetical protein
MLTTIMQIVIILSVIVLCVCFSITANSEPSDGLS